MTASQQRLDELHTLTAEARKHAAHPHYTHGDVSSAVLAYVCDAIPEEAWQEAMQHARRFYVERAAEHAELSSLASAARGNAKKPRPPSR